MAERIDIEREAEKIAHHALYDVETVGVCQAEIEDAIKSLCTRYANERREEDAKVPKWVDSIIQGTGGRFYDLEPECAIRDVKRLAGFISQRTSATRNGEQPADPKGTKG